MDNIFAVIGPLIWIFVLLIIGLAITHFVLMGQALSSYVREWEIEPIFGVFAWIPGLQFITLGYIYACALADKFNWEMMKAGLVVAGALIFSFVSAKIPFGGTIVFVVMIFFNYQLYKYTLPTDKGVTLYTVLSSLIVIIAQPLCLKKALKAPLEG